MDSQLTQLITKVAQGDGGAREALWELVYEELRGMAHRQAAHGRAGGGGAPGGGARGVAARGMQTTALVHEAYLRLLGPEGTDREWATRRHFFAAAAEAMRRVCVDDARKRRRLKRGGDRGHVSLSDRPGGEPSGDGRFAGGESDPAELLAVHEALDKLEGLSPRQAQVVKLRYFVGMSIDEAAEVLEVSPRTVDADWKMARAWLHRALSEPRP